MKPGPKISTSKDKKRVIQKTPTIVSFLLGNYAKIAQVVGCIVAVIFAYVLYRSSTSAVQNLINANDETLKTAFFGKLPHLFYCNRGAKDEGIPPVFSELHSFMGSKMGFSVLNCSQVLRSGKTIWQRFKLKKEWRPSVFATAPWLKSKAIQVLPTSLNDLASMKKFVETSLAPRGTEVNNDKQLVKLCNFSSDSVPSSTATTCLIIIKGNRFTKEHAQLEAQLVLAHPDVPIASVDAKKRRLSFEDTIELPADQFAMKIHALRDSVYYLSMVYPISAENIKSFVDHALSTTTSTYFGDKSTSVRLVKPAVPSFKSRGGTTNPKYPEEQNSKQSNDPKKSSKTQSERKTESSSTNAGNSGTSSESSNSGSNSAEEDQVRRQQRESEIRENMERKRKEYLYDDNNEVDGHEAESDDEEDVIEL